ISIKHQNMRTLHLLYPFCFLLFFGACADKKQAAKNNAKEAQLYVTTPDKSSLLEKQLLETTTAEVDSAAVVISVDTSKTFQEMDGFGYTLTGGSALHLQK